MKSILLALALVAPVGAVATSVGEDTVIDRGTGGVVIIGVDGAQRARAIRAAESLRLALANLSARAVAASQEAVVCGEHDRARELREVAVEARSLAALVRHEISEALMRGVRLSEVSRRLDEVLEDLSILGESLQDIDHLGAGLNMAMMNVVRAARNLRLILR